MRVSRRSTRQTKAVAHSGFREQESRAGGIGLNFLAELIHVDAKVMAFLTGAGAPDFVQELAVGHDPVGIFHQHAKHAIFIGGQMNRLAVDGDFAPAKVDAKLAGFEDGLAGLGVGAGQMPKRDAHAARSSPTPKGLVGLKTGQVVKVRFSRGGL